MSKRESLDWIDNLPAEWSAVQLNYLLVSGNDAMKVGPFGTQLSGNDFTDDGYWVYNQRTVVDQNFEDNNTFVSEEKYNAMKSFQVEAGDILITTRGTIGRICKVPEHFHRGIIHPCIIKFRIDENKILYDLVRLLFNESDMIKEQLVYMSNATTIDVVYSGPLKNVFIPVAPIKTQRSISAYLDAKCSEIDALTADIQSQIDTLEQYKRSVITEAVTKGLDKDVEMKDSGIDGAGVTPSHWKTTRLCYECYIRARLGWRGLKADEYVDEGYAFISAFNIQNGKLVWTPLNYITKERFDESPEIKLHSGDVLIVKDGAGVGKCARIDDLPMGGTAPNSSIAVITPSKNLDYRYVCYYLQSAVFNNFVLLLYNGMGVPHLTQEVMSKIKILMPPLKEQMVISDYLDAKCTEIDAVVETKKSQLATLDEYKKSLIFEYVTGKKEVPSA